MRRRDAVIALAATVAAVALADAAAGSTTRAAVSERVTVRPAAAPAGATLTVSFRAPPRRIAAGVLGRRAIVSASTASVPSAGCVSRLAVRAPAAAPGAPVRVVLSPASVGGDLCSGRFNGELRDEARPACKAGQACPQYIVLLVLGRFSFEVTARASGRQPAFAGLASAFACTPGPQRPGQTTPFTLSWRPASEPGVPAAQFVYDVFLASMAGGEDYTRATWTTPPGATMFRTPGLPSHGPFYFVVRARDAAGDEDRNTVERRGIDPCY